MLITKKYILNMNFIVVNYLSTTSLLHTTTLTIFSSASRCESRREVSLPEYVYVIRLYTIISYENNCIGIADTTFFWF
jgi:hypothetical protein